MIKYYRIVGGPLSTNTYVVYSGSSGVIVDPGVPASDVEGVIRRLGITKIYLIIATHGHFDHVFYAGSLSRLYDTKLLIHELDFELLNKNKFLAEVLYGDTLAMPESLVFVRDDTLVKLNEELEIRILHTPGHTRGSLCFLVGDLLITGDTLFKNTIGRTDFPESSARDMRSSLIKLAELPGDYVVLPGHGDITTLEYERKTNPYLRSILRE
ncbi:MAG: MBL fold metallo-hydrolase [Thermoprotei archaeon]